MPSWVTEGVLVELQEWRRPMDSVDFSDSPLVKVTDEVVRRRRVYLAMGIDLTAGMRMAAINPRAPMAASTSRASP